MKKILIVSRDIYNDLDINQKQEFIEAFNRIVNSDNIVCFVAEESNNIDEFKNNFLRDVQNLSIDINLDRFCFKSRSSIESRLKSADMNKYFIVLGNKKMDFLTAVTNKLLYLVPLWVSNIDDKSNKYGIKIDSIDKLEKVIQTVNNQNTWYYTLELPDGTKVYSLTSGNNYIGGVTPTENELINGFRAYLKEGIVSYYEILLYHFLAGISNNPEFKDVSVWAICPSSSLDLNNEMMDFKEHVRYMMGSRVGQTKDVTSGKVPNNLFLRTKKIEKSRDLSESIRAREGAGRHLNSIKLNPAYKGKLKGRVVCVLDDYLNHGNTFEAMRNILKTEGVKKIIMVSLGRFNRRYCYQEYELKGDFYTERVFTHCLKSKSYPKGYNNDKAREEVRNLHRIFNDK